MRNIDIVLTEAFPILSLSLVTEPLRVANRESLEGAFAWRLLSEAGGVLTSSSGISIETEMLDEVRVDAVILLASYRPEMAMTPTLLNWLKRRARTGALMGCVDTGALIFAEAGLLSRHTAAVHYEAMAGYAEIYGETVFVDRLYDFSPPRCSAAGGVATIDMTLAMIEHYAGADLARRVAGILTYLPSGHLGAQERLIDENALARTDRRLAAAVDLMLTNIATPMPVTAIAKRLGLTVQGLARLFQRHTGMPPGAYSSRLRLERARNLLRNSHHPVGMVAILCGFENHETFTRAYRRRFGLAPSRDRSA